jgi:hypothetical protein
VKLSVSQRPSIGFLAVCATYLLVAAFFLFGLTTPDLDRVWRLHHLLKIGEVSLLDPADKALLTEAMARHERLASNLVDGEEIGVVSAHMDGWIETGQATLIRTPASGKYLTVRLQVETPADLLPMTAVLRGPGWQQKVEIAAHGEVDIPFPEPASAAEIIEIVLQGERLEAEDSVPGVRVSFGEKR